MGRSQRAKGRRGELEASQFLADRGIEAGPPRLDQTRSGGHDLDTDAGACEVKRRAALPAYIIPAEGVAFVLARGDRGRWLVVQEAEEWCAREVAVRELRVRVAELTEALEEARLATR